MDYFYDINKFLLFYHNIMKVTGLILLCVTLVSGRGFYAEENPVANVFDFVRGMVQSLNEGHKLDNLEKCLKDCDPLIDQYVEIWNLIVEFDPTRVLELIELVQKTYEDTKAYFKSCSGAPDEIKNFFEAFTKVNFFDVISKIIIENDLFAKYINDFKNATSAIEAGIAIGHILYRFVLEEYLLEAPAFDFTDFVKIIEGYFEVLVNKTVFKDLDACLKQFPEVYKDFLSAIKKLREMDISNPAKIIDAFISLFNAIVHLLNATKRCSHAPEVLEEMIEKFLNVSVSTLFRRIMNNFPKVLHYVSQTVNGLNDKNYTLAGRSLGNLVRILIYDKPPKDLLALY